MNLNEQFISHINNKSKDIVSLIQKKEISQKEGSKQTSLGSDKHKKVIDLTDKIDSSQPTIQRGELYNGKTVEIWVKFINYKIGLGKNKYTDFLKFITSLYKNREIKKVTTFEYLEKIVFDWIISSYQKTALISLIDYIITDIKKSTVNRTYCFPILNLDIFSNIKIGDVILKYFTKENFDELYQIKTEKDIEDYRATIEGLRHQYQGMVVASIELEGISEKSKEIALEKCLLVIDILKICSDTLDNPDLPLSFDIDSRAKEQLFSQCIKHDIGSFNNLLIDYNRVSFSHKIDHSYLTRMLGKDLSKLSKFIFHQYENNELAELLINAIKNFSEALSNKDLNKRIVDLFSIFESLLLPNEKAPIQESLKKYGTKLISKSPEQRSYLMKLFVRLYDIRSSMVHHGKRKEIKLIDLAKLQIALWVLIIVLIKKTDEHSSKTTIFKEIDDAILKAY
jgi:hypothetical protein